MAIIRLHADLSKLSLNDEHNRRLSAAKHDYFAGELALEDCPFVSYDVAASWARLRRAGKNPAAAPPVLAGDDHGELTPRQQLLVRACVPLIKSHFNEFFTRTGLLLTDSSGMVLFAKPIKRGEDYEFPRIHARISENYSGTNAISLCMRHRETVFLFGSEHFYNAENHRISCASPILDRNGEPIGALAMLADTEGYDGQDMATRRINVYMIGWTKSLALAVSNQVKLAEEAQRLLETREILHTTIAVMDEGLITVDRERRIVQINTIARSMLGLSGSHAFGGSLFEVLPLADELTAACDGNAPLLGLEREIPVGGKARRLIIDIFPCDARRCHSLAGGAVLRLIPYVPAAAGGADEGENRLFSFADIMGRSAPARELTNRIRRIAPTAGSVLLLGESGTGKELFAQAIHSASGRSGQFVALNCSSVPRNLVESELFGYEGGAFTGAERRGRVGKIELAHGGTLFLDEIGDMPLELQPVLLRVLQEKRIMRVGGNKYIPVDFRIIAATNRDLTAMVRQKQFREDLFYRLAVFSFTIPPLRQRREDILDLAEYFLDHTCEQERLRQAVLAPDAKEALLSCEWPGNVRQLENAMIYAAFMADPSGVIHGDALPEELARTVTSATAIAVELSPLQQQEKDLIRSTLSALNGNINQAARQLQVSRSTLYRRMKQYGLTLSPR